MTTALTHKERVAAALEKIPMERLSTAEDVAKLLIDLPYGCKVGRYRTSALYRGLHNSAYDLTTTLQRNCKSQASRIEGSILRNFAKYAISDEPNICESVWRQMAIGQHHGLPTRLLDWSYSPLVALHFATSSENFEAMDQHDGVIWKIDIEEIHALLPDLYQGVLYDELAYVFTVDMLERAAKNLVAYDDDMRGESLVLLEPPSIDQRIINQYSYFSVMPTGIDCFEEFLAKKTTKTVRYIIDKDIRWKVRDMLDQFNMNERIMYPGLDGLTAWLKRHYYVKD